jgi:Sodium:neurotransmitter symporter family
MSEYVYVAAVIPIASQGENEPLAKEIVEPDEDPHRHPHEREHWGRGVEFLFSCISMSVGLGNLWRFPFVAYGLFCRFENIYKR